MALRAAHDRASMSLILALSILMASTAMISAQQKFAAPLSLLNLPGSEGPKFFPVGGDHGWNLADDPTLFQKWSAANLKDIKQGDVLVFTSSPGTQHSVRVAASTADDMATGSLPCASKLATADIGTNRFTSNVSLVILRPNVTYVVTSGQKDCQRGLGFYFLVPADPSQTYYVDRDVGVAYNLGYFVGDSAVTSFGNLVPPQDSAYMYLEAVHDRTFFNGDILNVELPGLYQLNLYTNGNSSASATKNEVTLSFKGADDAQTYLVSVGLAGLSASGFQRFYHITFSATASSPGLGSGSGTYTLADFSIRNVTSVDTCKKNPGTPYLCSRATFSSHSGNLIGSFILLVFLVLAY